MGSQRRGFYDTDVSSFSFWSFVWGLVLMKGEYKNILFDIFSVLGFSDTEKEEALQTFKKKLAFELLKSIQGELPQNQQDWLAKDGQDMNDPVFSEIQKTIQGMYNQEVLYDKSKPLFKKLVSDYVEFMANGLEAESTAKLKEILNNL